MKGTERPNILFTHAPYIDHLPRREKSIAAAPGEGGYATWHVGKWHLGPRKYYPDRHGEGVNGIYDLVDSQRDNTVRSKDICESGRAYEHHEDFHADMCFNEKELYLFYQQAR